MSKVTLKDIAKIANISSAAVSIILNNKPSRISEEKKAEVKKIAKELNYRPNIIARSLLSTSTKTIGILIPDIENPFFSKLVREIEQKMSIDGYSTLIANSNDIYANDIHHINEFLDRQVDGIIVCVSNEAYLHMEEFLVFLENIDAPLVFVDRLISNVKKRQVVSDNKLGGYLATQFLLEKPIKHLAVVTGGNKSFVSNERLKGVQQALAEINISISVDFYEGDFHFQSGYDIGLNSKILTEHTGIFCFNDLMAYGLLKANKIKKIKNIEMIGYDNLAYADMFGITLPSINQNISHLAENAIIMLRKSIENGNESEVLYLEPKL
jgi:transcriptional regulator, lacI family